MKKTSDKNFFIIHNFYLLNLTIFFFIILIAYYISNNFLPAEDAAILFRYSQNFSNTGIISYNPNSLPTEGATDFLWMIILSIFNFLKFDIFFSAIFLNLLSLLLISNFFVNYFKLPKIYLILIFLLHLSIPISWASLEGFSVLFVELFFVIILFSFNNKKLSILLIYFSLLGCLVRPDFVLFCFFPCLIMTLKEIKNKKFLIHLVIVTFIALIYFIWRLNYFNFFFPLPFYIKNTWIIFNNKEFLRIVVYLLPLILAMIFYSNVKFIKNIYINIFLFLILPTVYYSSQTLYQNLGYRFYFYFVPYLLYLFFLVIKFSNIQKIKIYFLFLFTIINSIILHFIASDYRPFLFTKKSEIYKFSKSLEKNFTNDLKIATTEAGIIPFYSKQFTVDLWGLNTPEFTKKPAGGNYILNEKFDIIIINSSIYGNDCNSISIFLNEAEKIEPKFFVDRKKGWIGMVKNLFTGINNNYDFYLLPYVKHLDRNIFMFINKKSFFYFKITQLLKKEKIQKCKN